MYIIQLCTYARKELTQGNLLISPHDSVSSRSYKQNDHANSMPNYTQINTIAENALLEILLGHMSLDIRKLTFGKLAENITHRACITNC